MESIFTSYFSNYRMFPEDSYTISIARSLVGNISVDCEYKPIAPKTTILYPYKNGEINEEEYTEMYVNQLTKNKSESLFKFMRFIYNRAKTNNVILLCYEKKGKFCHRHILRNLINEIFIRENIPEITEL